MSKDYSLEIEQIARGYVGKSSDELFILFLQEWRKVSVEEIPVRGNAKDFWLGVKEKLVKKIIKNREAISATIEFLLGVVTAEVIQWARSVGLNLTILLLPMAIFVAFITQSIIDQLKNNQSK